MGPTPGVTEVRAGLPDEPAELDAAELLAGLPGGEPAEPDALEEELPDALEPALLDGAELAEFPDAPLVQDDSRVSVGARDAVPWSDFPEEALVQGAVRLDEVQDVTGVRDAEVVAARLCSPELEWPVFQDAQLAGNAQAPLLRAALLFASR